MNCINIQFGTYICMTSMLKLFNQIINLLFIAHEIESVLNANYLNKSTHAQMQNSANQKNYLCVLVIIITLQNCLIDLIQAKQN